MAAAGAVTGNPMLIAGGASIFTGDMAADASKKAAQTQSDAADKAMDFNKQVYQDTSVLQRDLYNQSRADLAPYMSLGSGVMGNLGNMVGVTPSAAAPFVSSSQTGVMPPAADPRTAVPRPGESPQAQAAMATQSGYSKGGTISGLAGQTVLLQAPDGAVRAVPAGLAAQFEAKGARRVPTAPGGRDGGLV
jgi:hypothetical protein